MKTRDGWGAWPVLLVTLRIHHCSVSDGFP